MSKHTPLTLAAILLATTAAAASAQTAQDHAAHHPTELAQAESDATAQKLPGCPGGTADIGKNGGDMPMKNMGSMMDGGMGQMMGAMQPGRGGSAMMPFAHTEGRIAFIKAELAITDAQTPQWNAFADALRAGSKNMRETMTTMAAAQPEKPWTAADRTGAMVQMMTARLDGMKTIAASEKALYAVLTDAQKETADDLLGGPMMGMSGRM